MLKKRKKISFNFVIVIALLLIVSGTAIFVSTKWKPAITKKLKSVVYEGSNQLYRIDFKDIHIDLLNGTIVLDSLILVPDSVVYNRLKAKNEAPVHLFSIKMTHLKFREMGLLTAYFKKKVNVRSIEVDNPSIDMIYHKMPKKIKIDERTFYQQIAQSVKAINVRHVSIVNANFDYYNGAKKLNAIKHLDIKANAILIDSLSQFDSTRVLYAKSIGFELIDYKSLTKDKMYTLKIDTVRGALNQKMLTVKGFKLIPSYPELTFSRQFLVQKDRYDFNFSEIKFEGVNYLNLFNDGDLHIKNVKIGKSKVAVFMNRALPPPAIDKGKNYPHIALKRLPIATIIEKISLHNVDVFYTEYNPKTNAKGTLQLANLSGSILNVTNDSIRLQTKSHAIANLTTNVMRQKTLKLDIDFNLTSPTAAFTYTGHIGAFDLKILNPLAKPLGLIAIESGKVQQLDFKISANNKRSTGKVWFRYDNLKIDLLKKNDQGKAKDQGFLSFLANTLLIKDSNPAQGENIRVANITFDRMPQASFFNLMWKSVFVGIRETVGIGMVPMKKMPEPKRK